MTIQPKNWELAFFVKLGINVFGCFVRLFDELLCVLIFCIMKTLTNKLCLIDCEFLEGQFVFK